MGKTNFNGGKLRWESKLFTVHGVGEFLVLLLPFISQEHYTEDTTCENVKEQSRNSFKSYDSGTTSNTDLKYMCPMKSNGNDCKLLQNTDW